MIKRKINVVRGLIEEKLRQLCGHITPDKRVAAVIIAMLLFGIGSIWITVSSIYGIGKQSGRNYEIEHIEGLEIEDAAQKQMNVDSLKNNLREQYNERR